MQTDMVRYFQEKSELDTLSVTEIESLIARFPYSSVYRMLLAKKMPSAPGQHIMLYTDNRLMLHDLSQMQGVEGEIATLPDQENMTAATVPSVSMAPTAENGVPQAEEEQKFDVDPEAPVITAEEDQHAGTPASDRDLADEQETPDAEDKVVVASDEKSLSEPLHAKVGKSKSGKKKGKKKSKKFLLKEFSGLSEFSKWLLSLKEPDLEKKIKKEEKEAKKRELRKNVMKSVTKKESLVSESLADLLASQGHLDDAKKMYEQLMQKFPEKSSYFAAKINDLLNKS